MQTLNLSMNEVNEQMRKLQEIKAFLEGATAPLRMQDDEKKSELQINIHKYWE